jgi:FixJ family two-component response regulator
MLDRSAPRPTIYVVDDDAAVRSALAFALDLEGYQVRTYASGEALLQSGSPTEPGCLVLDERLPGASGMETLRLLRERSVNLPAVFVTSHPKPSFRTEAALADAPILEKPLLDEALTATIEALLAR